MTVRVYRVKPKTGRVVFVKTMKVQDWADALWLAKVLYGPRLRDGERLKLKTVKGDAQPAAPLPF